MSTDYRKTHSGPESRSKGYDQRLFGPGKYEWELWQREKRLLDAVFDRFVPHRGRLLDFACGTARILAHLEGRFDEAIGLDLSPTMLENARPKLRHARLICGDATRDPGLVAGSFDMITAFRFFLNAQPALRDAVLDWMAPRLRDERSLLFFNIHGNRWSSRQIVARVKRWQGKEVHWMTPRQVRRMVARHGLEVAGWWGLGYLDKFLYKRMPKAVWRGVEGVLQTLHAPPGAAVNLYFACRRKPG